MFFQFRHPFHRSFIDTNKATHIAIYASIYLYFSLIKYCREEEQLFLVILIRQLCCSISKRISLFILIIYFKTRCTHLQRRA